MPLLVAPPEWKSPEWLMDVERGPGWLFIRLHGPPNGEADHCDLADRIWKQMEQHLIKRLVLELEDLPMLRSALIGQLVLLHKRICSNGGVLHLSGLSDHNQEVLSICRLSTCFPQYHNREEAVMMGYRPSAPR